MKRIISCVIFLLFAVIITINASEHLEFDGIPICGNKDDFAAALEHKGYERISDQDLVCHNNSPFDNSIIRVVDSGEQKQVQMICEFLPESSQWDRMTYK